MALTQKQLCVADQGYSPPCDDDSLQARLGAWGANVRILVGRWLAFNTQDGSAHLECLDTQRIPDLIKFIFELGLDLGQGEDEADIGRDRKDGEQTFAS